MSGRVEQREGPPRCVQRGAGGQAQVREDLDNELRIFDGSVDLQAATTVWAVFDIDMEYVFEQSRPTHARRR